MRRLSIFFLFPLLYRSQLTVLANDDIVTLLIHRNGEADACGSVEIPLQRILSYDIKDKYQVERDLTEWIADALNDSFSCYSTDNSTAAPLGLYGYCDMGPERTPILLDHHRLVSISHNQHKYKHKYKYNFLPCRWHTREGLRITLLQQLLDVGTRETTCHKKEACSSRTEYQYQLHLYGVPAGRLFVFAPSYVGEVFDLSHVLQRPHDQPITMTVLNLSPRVFDIHNVFSAEETDELVHRALKETSPSLKLHRSTTGTVGHNLFEKRTSENAFDSHGRVAVQLKKRILEVLGMEGSYQQDWMGHDDGIQVLRYNKTTAYVPHLDYFEDDKTGTTDHDYDSSRRGGNRFATVLLYMSDLPERAGGETVFTETPANISLVEALSELRDSGDAQRAGIVQNSWEETMVANCRRHFVVRPSRGRAVLFYSQLPNGELDLQSLHGGCPVLEGEKWAANLWVWNTPRQDFLGAPRKEGIVLKKNAADSGPQQLTAVFQNTGTDSSLQVAELWYDEGLFWGNIGHGDPPLQFNTYEGHRWNVRVNGKIVKEFVIGKEDYQEFKI